MPLYQTKCRACGAGQDFFRKIEDRDNLPSCSCSGELYRIIVAPAIRPDISPFQSPNGDYMINSRAQYREDLKRSNATAWEPGIDKDIARRKESEKEKAFKPIAEAVDRVVAEMAVCGKLET